MSVLAAQDLTKHYGGVTAVDGISFSVEAGAVFGLLGPNGAGKTSTINMLIGLARMSSGSVTVAGSTYTGRMTSGQEHLGIVLDESNLYDELTGIENLLFCAALYGMRRRPAEARARELLEEFSLEFAAKRPFKAYSRGMKRRLTIAAAIMHRPPILFLDEPTTGVDVASARQIRRLLLDMNAQGTTVFLTTHYIEEAERLCSRIAFLTNGRIVQEGTLSELMRAVKWESEVEITTNAGISEYGSILEESFPEFNVEILDESRLRVRSPETISLFPLLQRLDQAGAFVYEAKLVRPSLEDVFVQFTGADAGGMQ